MSECSSFTHRKLEEKRFTGTILYLSADIIYLLLGITFPLGSSRSSIKKNLKKYWKEENMCFLPNV